MKCDKLVRDRVPYILIKKKKVFSCREAFEEEYCDYAGDALLDRVTEYINNKHSLKTLADIVEIVYALALENNNTIDELTSERLRQLEEQGSYCEGIILEEVKDD